MYHEALPTVDEIKLFDEFVPPLYDKAVKILAYELINPWTCDYTPWLNYATENKTFGKRLEITVQKMIKHRVKVGKKHYERATNRYVLWSTQYYANLSNKKAKLVVQDIRKPAVKPPGAADSTIKQDGQRKTKKRGMRKPTARKQAQMPKDGSNGNTCHNDKETEHHEKPAKLNTVRCWACGECGHRSRNCPTACEDKEAPEKTKRSEDHESRHYKGEHTKRGLRIYRTKRDRYVRPIEVTGNGEGLRTCDREVHAGELTRTGGESTRTGLVI